MKWIAKDIRILFRNLIEQFCIACMNMSFSKPHSKWVIDSIVFMHVIPMLACWLLGNLGSHRPTEDKFCLLPWIGRILQGIFDILLFHLGTNPNSLNWWKIIPHCNLHFLHRVFEWTILVTFLYKNDSTLRIPCDCCNAWAEDCFPIDQQLLFLSIISIRLILVVEMFFCHFLHGYLI